MSDAPYYPELDTSTIKSLKIIQQLAQEDRSYWLTAPYSGEVQVILEALLAPKKVQVESAPTVQREGEADWEFLARETKTLYDGLKVAGVGLEGNELMAYYRTSTSLLEKLLGMHERANNLKQISDFYHVVLDIMESELNTDQRTKVMQRLQDATKNA